MSSVERFATKVQLILAGALSPASFALLAIVATINGAAAAEPSLPSPPDASAVTLFPPPGAVAGPAGSSLMTAPPSAIPVAEPKAPVAPPAQAERQAASPGLSPVKPTQVRSEAKAQQPVAVLPTPPAPPQLPPTQINASAPLGVAGGGVVTGSGGDAGGQVSPPPVSDNLLALMIHVQDERFRLQQEKAKVDAQKDLAAARAGLAGVGGGGSASTVQSGVTGIEEVEGGQGTLRALVRFADGRRTWVRNGMDVGSLGRVVSISESEGIVVEADNRRSTIGYLVPPIR